MNFDRRHSVVVWGVTLAVLCLGVGAVFGIFIDRYTDGRYDDPPLPYLDELTRRLELDDSQRTVVKETLDTMRAAIDKAAHRYDDGLRSELASLREEADKRIHEILNEEQQAIYDAIDGLDSSDVSDQSQESQQK